MIRAAGRHCGVAVNCRCASAGRRGAATRGTAGTRPASASCAARPRRDIGSSTVPTHGAPRAGLASRSRRPARGGRATRSGLSARPCGAASCDAAPGSATAPGTGLSPGASRPTRPSLARPSTVGACPTRAASSRADRAARAARAADSSSAAAATNGDTQDSSNRHSLCGVYGLHRRSPSHRWILIVSGSMRLVLVHKSCGRGIVLPCRCR